jgi:hypothetical protein
VSAATTLRGSGTLGRTAAEAGVVIDNTQTAVATDAVARDDQRRIGAPPAWDG